MKVLFRILFLGILLLSTSLNSFARPYSVRAQSNNEALGSADILSIPVTENRKVRIACIGNSITFGHGIPEREKYSYPATLQTLLGPAFDVRNYGVSGCTLLSRGDSPYKNQGAYAQAKAFLPDIVIMKLGTNDSKSWNYRYIDEFDSNYMTFINELKALPSHPRIYICTPFFVYKDEPGDGIKNQRIGDGIVPRIKAIAARESLDLVDFYSLTEGRPELLHDGVHPNMYGTRLMAENIINKFIETLSVNNPYTVAAGPENLWLVSTAKPGSEFVEWSNATDVYDQPSVLYSQAKGTTFTATFKKVYPYPSGSTENSRYLKKLWAETDGRRYDIVGTATSDVTSHSGKLLVSGNNEVVVKRGGSFTLKSVSNNPSPASGVNPMRYAVILPFADWNGDLEFSGRDTNESLPMIGRAGNETQTDADAMAVVNLNKTFTVPADARLGKIHFRLNYTDGKSADVGYGTGVITHTACGSINSGLSVEIVLNVIEDGAKFSFTASADSYGRVDSDTPNGTYDVFKEIRLKAVPADDDHRFLNWTDQNGNIISLSDEFVYVLTENIILKANFEEKHYPRLTHYYMTNTQVNRFLNKATYTVAGTTKTIFDLGTSFTKIPVNTDVVGDAMVTMLEPRIVLPEGTSSFAVTCFSTHRAIAGCNNELGWCNQAAMVDWNSDFTFRGSEIYTPTNFSGAEIPGHTFGSASGYSRTITVPAGQKSGVYRMYIMYGEPTEASTSWPSEMLADGRVRDGNVYEFDIQLGSLSGLESVSSCGANVYVSGDRLYMNGVETGSIINVVDISGRSVLQTVAESESINCVLPGKGVYIVNIQNGAQSNNFKVIY